MKKRKNTIKEAKEVATSSSPRASGVLSLKIMGKGECFGEEEILIKRGCEFYRVTTI